MTSAQKRVELLQQLHTRICALEGKARIVPDMEPGMDVYTHTGLRRTQKTTPAPERRAQQMMLLRRAKDRQQTQTRVRNRWDKMPTSYAQEQSDTRWDRDQKIQGQIRHIDVIQEKRLTELRRLEHTELLHRQGIWEPEYPDCWDSDEDEQDNIQKRYPDLYMDLKPIQDTGARMNSNQRSAVDELVKLGLEGVYLEYLGGYDRGQPGHWEPVVTYLDESSIRDFVEQNKTILSGIRDTDEYRTVVEDAVRVYTDHRFNPDFLQIALRNFILAVIQETLHD